MGVRRERPPILPTCVVRTIWNLQFLTLEPEEMGEQILRNVTQI